MSDIVKYFLKFNKSHLLLALLMIVYILFPLPLPVSLATFIDTKMGSLFVVTIAILTFLYVNPVVGILAFVTGYILLHRAGVSTGSEVLRKYLPDDDQKHQDMLHSQTLQNGKTLEEQAVANIPPRSPDKDILPEDPYKPVYSSSEIEHSEL